MKFILSTLVFGAAASASAFDLLDGQQDTPKAPKVVHVGVPLAQPDVGPPQEAPPAPAVRATPATPSAPAATWVTSAAPEPPQEPAVSTDVRFGVRRGGLAIVQDQDDDLKREAAKLEAEVARLRQMLEEMRGEVAGRGGNRSAAPRVRVRREQVDREVADRGLGTRLRVQEARDRADQAMDRAKQAKDRATEAHARALDFAEQARSDAAAVKEKAKSKAKSKAKQSTDVWLERTTAPKDKKAAERMVWATSTAGPGAQGTWSTKIGSDQVIESDGGHMIFVRKSGDGGSAHETHVVKKSSSGGASTFNIQVEDGDVHIYAGGGPAGAHGGGGSFTFGGDLPKGAFAPKVMGIGGGSGGRFLFSADEDDDDDDGGEHEHADDDDHEHEHGHDGHDGHDDDDDDDRFVNVLHRRVIGVDELGNLAKLHDLEGLKNLTQLDSLVELKGLGIDLEDLTAFENVDVEFGDLHGLEGMILDVTSGLEDLGENVKVQVKVVGPDGEMIHHHGGAGLQDLLGTVHRNVIIEFEDEEEEEIEEEEEDDDDDRFVLRTNPSQSKTLFGLTHPFAPSAGGNHAQPAGFAVRHVALDQELLELAREIQQEVRAMRAELDELRRQVLGAAPKVETQPRARNLRRTNVRNGQSR